MEQFGLLLCDDLLFSSKVTGTADALQLRLRVVRNQDSLLLEAEKCTPSGILLDLHNSTLDVANIVARLGSVAKIIGFGSHVDTATLRNAREAGCTLVLPRSKFVELLPTELPNWLGKN